MTRTMAAANSEFCISLRNRWVAIAVVLMALFSFVLSAAGSAPTGQLGADKLSITVASLTSLAVYLVPLVALLMAFDAVAGEIERGTLSLMLTYPVSRAEILVGKFVAHLGILALALAVGYSIAAAVALWYDPQASDGIPALIRLFWSSCAWVCNFGHCTPSWCCCGFSYRALARGNRPLRFGAAVRIGGRYQRRIHQAGLPLANRCQSR
jgi:Cu-processing system permease protein